MSFPAVSNVFRTDAVPVTAVTELAVITPVVLLFKVTRVLASDTVVSVIVTDSVPILLIPFSVLAVAAGSVPVVPVALGSVPLLTASAYIVFKSDMLPLKLVTLDASIFPVV